MKKILYTTSLVFLPSSFKRWIYGGNIMLYRISVTERGLTGIANIFRSRMSRLDDLLGAGTVPLKGKCGKTISIVCCFLPKFANSGTLIPMAPFALLSAGMSAGIRDVTRYDKTFDAALWFRCCSMALVAKEFGDRKGQGTFLSVLTGWQKIFWQQRQQAADVTVTWLVGHVTGMLHGDWCWQLCWRQRERGQYLT